MLQFHAIIDYENISQSELPKFKTLSKEIYQILPEYSNNNIQQCNILRRGKATPST